jgi:hypothetical protein
MMVNKTFKMVEFSLEINLATICGINGNYIN